MGGKECHNEVINKAAFLRTTRSSTTWAVGSARGLLGLYGPYQKKTDRLAEKMASTRELS